MAGTGRTSIRTYTLYQSGTVAGVTFAGTAIPFVDQVDATPFRSQGIILKNDHTANSIEFSFDGTTVHGLLKFGEIITFDFRKETIIYLRGTGVETFRVWAW